MFYCLKDIEKDVNEKPLLDLEVKAISQNGKSLKLLDYVHLDYI